jgi:hypothetical protein
MNVEFIILTIHHFLFFSKNANFKNYTILKFLIFLIQLIGLTQNVTMPDSGTKDHRINLFEIEK